MRTQYRHTCTLSPSSPSGKISLACVIWLQIRASAFHYGCTGFTHSALPVFPPNKLALSQCWWLKKIQQKGLFFFCEGAAQFFLSLGLRRTRPRSHPLLLKDWTCWAWRAFACKTLGRRQRPQCGLLSEWLDTELESKTRNRRQPFSKSCSLTKRSWGRLFTSARRLTVQTFCHSSGKFPSPSNS